MENLEAVRLIAIYLTRAYWRGVFTGGNMVQYIETYDFKKAQYTDLYEQFIGKAEELLNKLDNE